MLKIENINYKYENMNMCFNFDAYKGEVTAILGQSGAGKSTLLSLISGFISPHLGDIKIDGKSILKQEIHQRDVSILFQENNLFAHLNLHDNIALGVNTKLKLNKNEEKELYNLAKKFQIENILYQLPSEVSGGQKQRAALCRTILREKSVLLLDEPFSALDEELKDELLSLIKELSEKQNLCVLMVTHSKDDAKKVASKIITICEGKNI